MVQTGLLLQGVIDTSDRPGASERAVPSFGKRPVHMS